MGKGLIMPCATPVKICSVQRLAVLKVHTIPKLNALLSDEYELCEALCRN